ncbi:MAG TPA: helix-turn-helix domain-containing protein [Ktedonobacteraceae bacterium]|nr:helix-turn-helix domain-containing protein [Ktedonobacteraceae bacterium]
MEKHLPWNLRLKYERQRRGWSQEKLADKIGSNTRTIARWERGLHAPTLELKQQLARVFETTIEALGLLPTAQETSSGPEIKQDLTMQCKEDWGEAPRRQQIYGREQELALTQEWISEKTCRTIALLGIGGVGKTTLTVELATHVKSTFEFLFWRSLKNAPPLKTILAECIEFLTRQQPDFIVPGLTATEEDLLALLLTLLRNAPCLLILDNFESVMQQHTFTGQYRQGYEGYGELLRCVSVSEQPGCLILTSREKPTEILHAVDNRFVRTLNLDGLNEEAGKAMLKSEHLHGKDADRRSLVQRLSGNPLALKLIAESIRELFDNEVAAFLSEGEAVFGGVQKLLDQQFERLSPLEQELLYSLAIEREATTPHDLQRNLAHFVPRSKIIEALESLRRRSLIETGSSAGNFTIQPVIMEYTTGRLVEHVCYEIMEETPIDDATSTTGELPWHLSSLPLVKAETKDYIRHSQVLLILKPIVNQICATYGEQKLLARLKAHLHTLRIQNPQHPGYLAGNILNLLLTLHANLRDFDFSQLRVRQVDLRNVALPGVNFAHADLSNSIFNDAFSTVLCMTLSHDGTLLAAGTSSGEIRIWLSGSAVPLLTLRGHSDWIRSLAFSLDGNLLVSGSEDRMLRVWDAHSGRCLMVLEGHQGSVRSVAFSPDNEIVASGSEDGTLRLWNIAHGTCLKILRGHENWIRSVAFNPTGSLLASGSEDQTVRLWNSLTGQSIKVLRGHNATVRSVAFGSDGILLASAGDDMAIRLWDVQSGQNIRTLQGHRNRVRTVCFNRGGNLVASGCEDSTARIWNAQNGELLFTLHGHTNRVSSLTFTSDNQALVTAGEDQTIRFWEVHTGRCTTILQGRTSLIKAMAFSPDGRLLAEGNDDRLVRVWDISTRTCARQLRGHSHRIRTVSFSPDGNLLASGSEDYTVRIWQRNSEQCLYVLQGHTHLIRSVAFNPDSTLLASASYDATVRLWDMQDGRCRAILRGHTDVIWSVAFCSDGQILVSSGKDQEIRLWDCASGKCIETLHGPAQRVRGIFSQQGTNVIITGSSDDQRICLRDVRKQQETWLVGHTGWIRTLDFHSNGKMVASGSQDQTLRLWNTETGQCSRVLHNESEISSVTFSPDGEIAAGGDAHGSIYLWSTRTGERLTKLRNERLYEGMNISGTRGLSETQREALVALGAVDERSPHRNLQDQL